MKIAVELTSILQVLFALSLLKKLGHPERDLYVDFIYLNNHVNNNTIQSTKKIISKFNFNSNYLDFRNIKRSNIFENKVDYDLLIVRSRVPLESHQKFIFSRGYFALTGNCNNAKLVLNNFTYKKLYTIDDGLSNWLETKTKYAATLLSNLNSKALFINKVLVLPLPFNRILSTNKFVSHYSIFSKLNKYSIKNEFSDLVKSLSNHYSKNTEVENLFIGVWPNFKDRSLKNNIDEQFDCFNNYLIKSNEASVNKKIFIKDHPKHRLDMMPSKYFRFERLDQVYIDTPLEVILGCFPNLKNIYGFPSTSLFLVDIISKNEISINLFVKNNDPKYFSDRADLFKSKNVRKIYI
jgi:hypothetical protein